jgi:hypothetical protein
MPTVFKIEHRAGIGVNHTHDSVATLKPGTRVQKGQETWRMNNSALKDPRLVNQLKNTMLNMTNRLRSVSNTVQTWLSMKIAIQGLLRRNGAHRAKLAKQQKVRLRAELK